MREHIFSNLFTKTELLIAPCWLAIASEGHIPRCVASKSWTEGHFQWLLIVCWWIRGEARPEDYVNGFHLCFTVVSQNWIINGWAYVLCAADRECWPPGLHFNNLIATIHDTTRSHEQLSKNSSILASFQFYKDWTLYPKLMFSHLKKSITIKTKQKNEAINVWVVH